MLKPIPYESIIRTPLYESDADGSLHIIIPPQNFGFFGMKLTYWGPALGFPPVLMFVASGLYRFPILPAASLAIAMTAAMMLFGWIDAYQYRYTTWIDATTSALTIRRQRGTYISNRNFSQGSLQAIGVVRQSDDVLSWDLRVHGRYEWEIVLSSAHRSKLDEIANCLRTFFKLPEKPASS